jgi:GNAT superfamily N-acetyltransferase
VSALVRPYSSKDREAVRQIAFDTALMGESASIFFDGEDFLKDALTLYFTDYEPQHIWIAENDGEVVGYALGAVNEKVLRDVHITKIFPHLLIELLRSGILFSKKNWKLFAGLLKAALSGEFNDPEFIDYPAILHINLKASARGTGVGSELISVLIEDLQRRGVKGIRLATMSIEAANFFQKNGFTILFEGHRSYLKEALGRDIPLFILGRKLIH